MTRRLAILPCPEPWNDMRPVAGGRHCERCDRRVTSVAELDEAGLERLLDRVERRLGACVRVELDGARARLGVGLAAGLVVATLAGCATPGDPGSRALAPVFEPIAAAQGHGALSGRVVDPDGDPIADALVVVVTERPRRSASTIEAMTDADGRWQITAVPAGPVEIEVYAGRASRTMLLELPEGARFRANFELDPDGDGILLGAVVQSPTLDVSSPASSYSSRLIEVD